MLDSLVAEEALLDDVAAHSSDKRAATCKALQKTWTEGSAGIRGLTEGSAGIRGEGSEAWGWTNSSAKKVFRVAV